MTALIAVLVAGVALASGGAVASAATVDVSSTAGPPGSKVGVDGTGFAANGIVEIYFDTTQVAFAVTDGSGAFGPRSIKVPSSADPGTHFVTVKNADAPGGGEHFYTVRTDWPQHRTGALRRGYNGHENVINPGNVGNLEEAWTPTLSSGHSARHGGPVVGGGILFFTARRVLGGRLAAYTIATRSERWSISFTNEVRSAPAWANSHVYVSIWGSSSPAQLQSRSASTGALEWRALLGPNDQSVNSAPAVAGGVVYATFINRPTDVGTLYAFGSTCGTGGATCTPLWQASLGTGNDNTSAAMVAKGRVFAVGPDGLMYAFAVGCGTGGATCSPQWVSSVAVKPSSIPAYSNGLVYVVGADGDVHAYRARGCTTSPCAPAFRLTGALSGSPAVAGGTVYALGTDGYLYAYPALCNTATCAHDWRGEAAPGSAIDLYSSPTVANGVVYAPTGSGLTVPGAVHAFAVGCGSGGATCPSLLDANTDDAATFAAVADGVLYVATDSPRVQIFDLPSATVASRRRAPSLRSLRPSRRLERQARRALSRLTGGAVAAP